MNNTDSSIIYEHSLNEKNAFFDTQRVFILTIYCLKTPTSLGRS